MEAITIVYHGLLEHLGELWFYLGGLESFLIAVLAGLLLGLFSLATKRCRKPRRFRGFAGNTLLIKAVEDKVPREFSIV